MKSRPVEDTRLVNARALAQQMGGIKAFADRLHKSQPQMQNTIGKTPKKAIGSELAREIDRTFGKTPGWLDIPWDLIEAQRDVADQVREHHAVTDDEVLQMALRELTRALVANARGTAEDFAALLREQAEHRKFALDTGLVDVVLSTVAQGQHVAVNAVQRASQAQPDGQTKPKRPDRSRQS